MSARLLDLSRAILTSGDLTTNPDDRRGVLCLALEDGTVVYVARPNQTLQYAEGMRRVPVLVHSQQTNAYVGSLLGSEDAIASTETRTGLIRTDHIPRVSIDGFDYLEFRLYGSRKPRSQIKTTLSGFQLFGANSRVSNPLSEAHLLYAMATQKLNSVVDFWDKSIEEGPWDVVLLIPDFYLKNTPVFLYFNVSLHHIQRDIQSALANGSAQPRPESGHATVTTGFKTSPAFSAYPTATSNGELKSHGPVADRTKGAETMVDEPVTEEIVLYPGSSQGGGSRSRRFLVTKSEKHMSKFMEASRRFMQDESGVTAIEYGLIASLIVVGLAASVGAVNGAINAAFTAIANAITPGG
jgi:pilus assembly protein Flp/PilA